MQIDPSPQGDALVESGTSIDMNISPNAGRNSRHHFHAGRHDEAAAWAALALRHAPDHHNALRINAAANALIGQLERAGNSIARLRQLDPILRVSNLQGHRDRTEGPSTPPDTRKRCGKPDCRSDQSDPSNVTCSPRRPAPPHASTAPRRLSSRPGRAPVCSPPSITIVPLTITVPMPAGYWCGSS